MTTMAPSMTMQLTVQSFLEEIGMTVNIADCLSGKIIADAKTSQSASKLAKGAVISAHCALWLSAGSQELRDKSPAHVIDIPSIDTAVASVSTPFTVPPHTVNEQILSETKLNAQLFAVSNSKIVETLHDAPHVNVSGTLSNDVCLLTKCYEALLTLDVVGNVDNDTLVTLISAPMVLYVDKTQPPHAMVVGQASLQDVLSYARACSSIFGETAELQNPLAQCASVAEFLKLKSDTFNAALSSWAKTINQRLLKPRIELAKQQSTFQMASMAQGLHLLMQKRQGLVTDPEAVRSELDAILRAGQMPACAAEESEVFIGSVPDFRSDIGSATVSQSQTPQPATIPNLSSEQIGDILMPLIEQAVTVLPIFGNTETLTTEDKIAFWVSCVESWRQRNQTLGRKLVEAVESYEISAGEAYGDKPLTNAKWSKIAGKTKPLYRTEHALAMAIWTTALGLAAGDTGYQSDTVQVSPTVTDPKDGKTYFQAGVETQAQELMSGCPGLMACVHACSKSISNVSARDDCEGCTFDLSSLWTSLAYEQTISEDPTLGVEESKQCRSYVLGADVPEQMITTDNLRRRVADAATAMIRMTVLKPTLATVRGAQISDHSVDDDGPKFGIGAHAVPMVTSAGTVWEQIRRSRVARATDDSDFNVFKEPYDTKLANTMWDSKMLPRLPAELRGELIAARQRSKVVNNTGKPLYSNSFMPDIVVECTGPTLCVGWLTSLDVDTSPQQNPASVSLQATMLQLLQTDNLPLQFRLQLDKDLQEKVKNETMAPILAGAASNLRAPSIVSTKSFIDAAKATTTEELLVETCWWRVLKRCQMETCLNLSQSCCSDAPGPPVQHVVDAWIWGMTAIDDKGVTQSYSGCPYTVAGNPTSASYALQTHSIMIPGPVMDKVNPQFDKAFRRNRVANELRMPSTDRMPAVKQSMLSTELAAKSAEYNLSRIASLSQHSPFFYTVDGTRANNNRAVQIVMKELSLLKEQCPTMGVEYMERPPVQFPVANSSVLVVWLPNSFLANTQKIQSVFVNTKKFADTTRESRFIDTTALMTHPVQPLVPRGVRNDLNLHAKDFLQHAGQNQSIVQHLQKQCECKTPPRTQPNTAAPAPQAQEITSTVRTMLMSPFQTKSTGQAVDKPSDTCSLSRTTSIAKALPQIATPSKTSKAKQLPTRASTCTGTSSTAVKATPAKPTLRHASNVGDTTCHGDVTYETSETLHKMVAQLIQTAAHTANVQSLQEILDVSEIELEMVAETSIIQLKMESGHLLTQQLLELDGNMNVSFANGVETMLAKGTAKIYTEM